MKKLSKKLDQHVIDALTSVCEKAKIDIDGFEWVTHIANFDNFPNSLNITCVFSTRVSLANARTNGQITTLVNDIDKQLSKLGIVLKSPSKQIHFDTEQANAKERLL
ncbi:MAG: hypothetical protein ACI96N_002626 [Arenicella sp.]|jgi:hypothetical protein